MEGVINSLHPPQFIASSFSSSINQKFIPERIRPNRIRDGDGDNEEKFRPHFNGDHTMHHLFGPNGEGLKDQLRLLIQTMVYGEGLQF